MKDKILNNLGLMRRANAIAIGETNTGAAARAGKAVLLLLASDASNNARSRAEGFVYGKSTIMITLPFTKEEISDHVGVNGCSMAAVTDTGFANALMKSLAALCPDSYEEPARQMAERFSKAAKRKKEAAAHERNKRNGKRRTNA
ncbi:MAG: 50S ribosomal protein L7 [Oscillospiraceae bacterium]|nr:50S ribosomal protein L7 [Oscillospiraceae bacterium]